MKLDFTPGTKELLSFLYLCVDPESAQRQITHSTSNLSSQKQHLIKHRVGTQSWIIKYFSFTFILGLQLDYIAQRTSERFFKEFKSLGTKYNSSFSHVQSVHLKGHQQRLHFISNLQGLKSEGTTNCCFRVHCVELAKRGAVGRQRALDWGTGDVGSKPAGPRAIPYPRHGPVHVTDAPGISVEWNCKNLHHVPIYIIQST